LEERGEVKEILLAGGGKKVGKNRGGTERREVEKGPRTKQGVFWGGGRKIW